jgi:hypothetical protein
MYALMSDAALRDKLSKERVDMIGAKYAMSILAEKLAGGYSGLL